MPLVNVDLGSSGTTTLDSSNWQSADTLQLSLASSGTLIVDGVDVTLEDVVGGGVISDTTIQVINGGSVTVDANVAGVSAGSTFTYQIGENSSLEYDAALISADLVNATTIDFQNANGTGEFVYDPGAVNLSLSAFPDVVNVQAGNQIEVVGSSSVSQSGDTVTFSGGLLGLPMMSFDIPPGALYTYDDATDTLTFTTCFLRGTRLATPAGDVAVEHLKVGDRVIALKGGEAAISWVGKRVLDPKALDKPRDTLPVRIRAGAISENVPSRDLFVSPDHCMFFDDALIPAKLLLNGTTITQEIDLEPFEYFHIELEKHDVVLAEGAYSESYLDLGNRGMFMKPGVLQFVAPGSVRDWSQWSYPPVYEGPLLDRIRSSLTARAEELGYLVEEAQAS